MGQADWMGRALGAAVLVVALMAAGPAGAADCAVALVVNADSPEFSRARVEQAIGDGLGAPIVRLRRAGRARSLRHPRRDLATVA